MKIEFDHAKNQQNMRTHGFAFEAVPDLDWDNAMVIEDTRKDYGEKRYRAFVRNVDDTPYSIAFTVRDDVVRIISFRRAHEKERKHYEQR